MPKVSDEIITLLEKQIQDYGIIVWYDPERHYTKLIEDLEIENWSYFDYFEHLYTVNHK